MTAKWFVTAVLLITTQASTVLGASLGALMSRADWSCVRLEPTGQACSRLSPPYAGIQVRYWQPVLLVETVKRPGETAINEFRPMLGDPLKRMAAVSMGLGTQEIDSASSGSSDTTSLQMNDVHVFGFPGSDIFSGLIEPVCEGTPELSSPVSYLSEMDAVEWRTLKNESNHPLSVLSLTMAPMCDSGRVSIPGMCIGSWGPMYPRGGFITGHSPVIGSAATAYRAIDVASAGTLSAAHRRVMPLLFIPDMFWDRMQMVLPQVTRCLRIGEDPRYWEQGKVSQDGKYVWIYWHKKECCAL